MPGSLRPDALALPEIVLALIAFSEMIEGLLDDRILGLRHNLSVCTEFLCLEDAHDNILFLNPFGTEIGYQVRNVAEIDAVDILFQISRLISSTSWH